MVILHHGTQISHPLIPLQVSIRGIIAGFAQFLLIHVQTLPLALFDLIHWRHLLKQFLESCHRSNEHLDKTLNLILVLKCAMDNYPKLQSIA